MMLLKMKRHVSSYRYDYRYLWSAEHSKLYKFYVIRLYQLVTNSNNLDLGMILKSYC